MIFRTHTIVWHLKDGIAPAVSPEEEVLSESAKNISDSSLGSMQLPHHNSAGNKESVSLSQSLNSEVLAASVLSDGKSLSENNTQDAIGALCSETSNETESVTNQVSLMDSSAEAALNEKASESSLNAVLASEKQPSYKTNEEVITDEINQNAFVPTVDGMAVSTAENIKAGDIAPLGRNTWMKLPYRLRPQRADIFIDKKSDADFVESLAEFLQSKGLKVRDYDNSVHYLPSDVLIVDRQCLVRQGIVMYLQDGKRCIYNKLLELFPGKLR